MSKSANLGMPVSTDNRRITIESDLVEALNVWISPSILMSGHREGLAKNPNYSAPGKPHQQTACDRCDQSHQHECEYAGSKQVVASDEIKQQILKTGIRKIERETSVSHHTVKKFLKGERVRRKTLSMMMKRFRLAKPTPAEQVLPVRFRTF